MNPSEKAISLSLLPQYKRTLSGTQFAAVILSAKRPVRCMVSTYLYSLVDYTDLVRHSIRRYDTFCVNRQIARLYRIHYKTSKLSAKGSFTLIEGERESEVFSLIFVAAQCEQQIKFPRSPSEIDVAFAFVFSQCKRTLTLNLLRIY